MEKYFTPYCKKTYPDEILAYCYTKPDFDDVFGADEILMCFHDDSKQAGKKMTIIEDPNKRYQAAVAYAKKYNVQIYTDVDGDDGEIYTPKE